jgi:DNA-binding MurR/RpiR family transcriptional regulator
VPSRSFVARRTGQGRSAEQPPQLSVRQRALIDFIERNPKFAAFSTAAELADRVGVHPATVVRLAQALGYQGFPDLQEVVRHRYLASLDAITKMHDRAEEGIGDVVSASYDQDLRNVTAARALVDREVMRTIAEQLLAAQRVVIVGNGSHAGLAIIFAHLCQFMGLPVDAEVRGGVSLATRIGQLGAGDVLIATASWWVIDESRRALQLARERGATTVAVVESAASELSRSADHVLVGPTESVSFFQSMSGPLAALNSLVAEIASIGGDSIRDRMAVSTEIYEKLGLARQESNGRIVSAPAAGRGP